ncbi:TatD family hydrolase [Microbacterium oleivorans]|uniref:TatD family hydrolase n=1 Tax=Microbacterium oleivorans TaxID=273677 RepID=UPI00140446B7|nr:TatD family hydrolase [Microbacterium oleivorans]
MPSRFPPLDTHAHIDPAVTLDQASALEGAQVFAMTRSLTDAKRALLNQQSGIYWAIGCHPAVPAAVDEWNEGTFSALRRRAFLVGEVGLDRRASGAKQTQILRSSLAASPGTVVSVHSAGRVKEVLDIIESTGATGVILHWFLGGAKDITRAHRLGCYFSVNAAMPEELLAALPVERVLPETDFPSSRAKTRATRPGDIRALEQKFSGVLSWKVEDARRHWFRVLGELLHESGALHRAPHQLKQLIAAAEDA